MSKKKKLKIKKLKHPFWFNILFFCLTILAPITLIIIEGLKAPNTIAGTSFKIMFMVFCAGIIVWFFMKKMIIDKIQTKLIAKQTALEHDYSIDVGNPEKIKYLWYQNETRLAIYNLISVILYGGLMIVILIGVSSALMKIKGLLIIIMTLYLVAYTLKFMMLIIKKGLDIDEDANSGKN